MLQVRGDTPHHEYLNLNLSSNVIMSSISTLAHDHLQRNQFASYKGNGEYSYRFGCGPFDCLNSFESKGAQPLAVLVRIRKLSLRFENINVFIFARVQPSRVA